jgi:hypothetical protein
LKITADDGRSEGSYGEILDNYHKIKRGSGMKNKSQPGVVGSGQDTNSQIIIYQTKDGQTKLDVRLENETVWLSQDQMAELYGKSKSTINEHIKNVYEEHELPEETTLRKFGNSEYSTKPTNFYNLDMIISVGYRVKSMQGTKFRIWATQRIKEYIIKGFTLDDERLKQGGHKARYLRSEGAGLPAVIPACF